MELSNSAQGWDSRVRLSESVLAPLFDLCMELGARPGVTIAETQR